MITRVYYGFFHLVHRHVRGDTVPEPLVADLAAMVHLRRHLTYGELGIAAVLRNPWKPRSLYESAWNSFSAIVRKTFTVTSPNNSIDSHSLCYTSARTAKSCCLK